MAPLNHGSPPPTSVAIRECDRLKKQVEELYARAIEDREHGRLDCLDRLEGYVREFEQWRAHVRQLAAKFGLSHITARLD